MATKQIITKECNFCGKTGEITVNESEYLAYINMEPQQHIQTILPNLSADSREMLITGTHPECWESMFGGSE